MPNSKEKDPVHTISHGACTEHLRLPDDKNQQQHAEAVDLNVVYSILI